MGKRLSWAVDERDPSRLFWKGFRSENRIDGWERETHMFQRSKGKKTMKWVTLLKDIKEKVDLTQSPSSATSSSLSPSAALSLLSSAVTTGASGDDHNAGWRDSSLLSPSRFDSLSSLFSLWFLLIWILFLMKWCLV